jgi:hypothetical protein
MYKPIIYSNRYSSQTFLINVYYKKNTTDIALKPIFLMHKWCTVTPFYSKIPVPAHASPINNNATQAPANKATLIAIPSLYELAAPSPPIADCFAVVAAVVVAWLLLPVAETDSVKKLSALEELELVEL